MGHVETGFRCEVYAVLCKKKALFRRTRSRTRQLRVPPEFAVGAPNLLHTLDGSLRQCAQLQSQRLQFAYGIVFPSRPDRPAGWANRIPDRAVLHWGAMRHFITLLGGNALRTAALANVTATARLILSRAQKKRKRRLLRAKSGVAAGRPDTQARATARVRMGWGRGVEVGPA